MNDRMIFRIYRLRARFLRNVLALLSLTAMFSACSNSTSKEPTVNQDSLNEVHRKDSIHHADSLARAEADSIAEKKKQDSIAASKKKSTGYVTPVNPVIPVDPGPICEYGVPPVYDPDPVIEQPMYGVPVPDQIMTKYGVPMNEL
ncbi:hypothetical protein SDC9_73279 [bioreactor metagenome]|uniref:Lipoprotein n=1 Tax=bioreactor metagenome TaxID=1076179 RepID=A0A644YKY5_9ZZZZ